MATMNPWRWLTRLYYRGLVRELELAVASEMRRADNLPRALAAWRTEIARLQMKLDRIDNRSYGVRALMPQERK
jgi:uncharacterized coiled-coil protein SlyX